MKKLFAVICMLLCSTAAFALDSDDSIVHWKSIVGVITIPGVDNPVAGIRAGATPWTVRNGHASVNLATGATFFAVEGLSINGGNSTGTPGPISAVVGTLVCNAGATNQAILDTPSVALNAHGNAAFGGFIQNIPSSCSNPLFLIRIAVPAGAAGRWIATATERFIGDDGL